MKTKVYLGDECREILMKGMRTAVEPVARSMGALGRNCVFNEMGMTSITNDGITILRNISLEDPGEAQGADLIRQASEQTNLEAGDGTSATSVLAYEISKIGLEEMKKGKNPMIIRKELEAAKIGVLEALKEVSRPIKNDQDLIDIANISVEDENIAKLVVDAVRKAGKYGAVMVEEGVGYTIEKTEEEGYWWDKGYISPYMVTNERAEAVLENPAVLITDKAINLNRELIGILNELHAKGEKSILLIADNVEGELLQTLIVNKMKSIMTVVAVKRPPSLDELEDIAILSKGTAVTKDKGIKDFALYHVGHLKKVIVKKSQTILIGQDSVELKSRVKDIETTLKDDKDNEVLKKRMGMLAGGIVKISVGAKTEAEMRYLRRKIEDCVCACNCAVDEGVVAGGGSTLRDLADKTDNPILKIAFKKPHAQILQNAGIEGEGDYNVLTGKKVKDYFKEGIIDPAKVVRSCISNAISTASMFITTEAMLTPVPEETKSKS